MGNKIKENREKCRISQEQLANKIGITGKQLYNIETEKTDTKLSTAKKIADYFKTTIDELFRN